jgi:hypothetical protein
MFNPIKLVFVDPPTSEARIEVCPADNVVKVEVSHWERTPLNFDPANFGK